jgi:hypothetical protein
VTFERRGIPSVAVITDTFVATADAMAAALDMTGYPFAVIAHPVSSNDDSVLRHKAEQTVAQALDLLLS